RIKAIWEQHLHMELEHLHLWGDMLRKYEGVEPEVMFGKEMTVDFKFQENKEYVRAVLEKQKDVRLLDHGWANAGDLPKDWLSGRYQDAVHEGGIPSEDVVQTMGDHGAAPERAGDELLARAREVANNDRA